MVLVSINAISVTRIAAKLNAKAQRLASEWVINSGTVKTCFICWE
jgi:hypothetical protein